MTKARIPLTFFLPLGAEEGRRPQRRQGDCAETL
jgi:hypothetical protein